MSGSPSASGIGICEYGFLFASSSDVAFESGDERSRLGGGEVVERDGVLGAEALGWLIGGAGALGLLKESTEA